MTIVLASAQSHLSSTSSPATPSGHDTANGAQVVRNLADVLSSIAVDCCRAPQLYLNEVVVPHGGE